MSVNRRFEIVGAATTSKDNGATEGEEEKRLRPKSISYE